MEKIQFGPRDGEAEAPLYGLVAGEKYRFWCRSGAGALEFESALFKVEESKVSDREKEAPVISLEFANGVTIQARTSYGLYFYRKLPLPASPPSGPDPSLCASCGAPCISRCSCGAHVHQSFGYNGVNCSGIHEAKCDVAKKSREDEKLKVISFKKKSVKKKPTRKKGRK